MFPLTREEPPKGHHHEQATTPLSDRAPRAPCPSRHRPGIHGGPRARRLRRGRGRRLRRRRRQDPEGPHRRTPGGRGAILEKDFEAATGVEVEVEVVPYDQIQTKAILDAQSGTNNYDVIQYWYTSVGALADAGAIADITDWVESDEDIDSGDFIEAIFGPYSQYEDATYGLPIDGDTHVLFYNKAIFERNGVEVPTTWDEYVEVSKKITDAEKANGVYGNALLGSKSAFNIGSTFFNRLATMSPDPIDPQMPQLDTEYAVAAAQSMLDASPSALPSPLEIGFEQALPQFLSGSVGMIEFWTDLGVFAQDPEQSKIVDGWGVAPLPVGPEGKVSGALNAGWAMGISPNASDEDLAKQFVAFASSKETNEKLITTTGSGVDPTRTSTLESPEYVEFAPRSRRSPPRCCPTRSPGRPRRRRRR